MENLNSTNIFLVLFIFFLFITNITLAETAQDYLNQGIEKLQKNDSEGAILDFNKSIEIDSTNSLAYYYRGLAEFKSVKDNLDSKESIDEVKRAISDMDKSIELDPENGAVYFHRGYAKIVLGQVNQGCSDISKAKELGYENPYKWDIPKVYCK